MEKLELVWTFYLLIVFQDYFLIAQVFGSPVAGPDDLQAGGAGGGVQGQGQDT